VRTPRIDGGRLLLLREVTAFDPAGGPERRGYLRAEAELPASGGPASGGPASAGPADGGPVDGGPASGGLPSDGAGRASGAALLWHGCLQAMAFYLIAVGRTIDRDGWRFEPVADRPVELRFGARPSGGGVTYEVFVTEAPSAPQPSLVADILCTVDGVPVLHARGAALRLVADWPLEHWRQLGPPRVQATGEVVPLALLGGLAEHRDEPPGTVVHGYRQLLASAWGRPSEVVGDASVDASPWVCRLPGPPYLMVSRIVAVDGPPGELGVGTRAVAEYDVPEQVWFFEQNDCPTMPMAVLMEVVLQPCGWLAAYVGSIRDADADLRFRNLDGAGTVLGEVRPGTRCLRSEVELLSVARQGDVVVERFGIRCLADGVPVFELTAVFGFFPQEAFDNQVGMPPSTEELDRYRLDGGEVVPLPEAGVRLAGPMLLMLDRVTGYWPDGGRAGLGLLRAEKDVDAGEWFFRCHFFQDPVWPGSLGIEAMCQLLRYYLVRRGALVGLRRPRFEPVMPGRELTWR
jgi:3-hydroxymyristoyl/3-hydroxydecanoyl-(acyl carrier protein) dehydratase